MCVCVCVCVCVCKRGHVGWGHSEQKQADEGSMSNRQVMFTPQVKPGWVGRGVQGLHPSAQALSRALQGWVTAFQVQGYAHTGLCLIWEQQGDWVGGQWEWPGRAVMPLGRLPVPVFAEGRG